MKAILILALVLIGCAPVIKIPEISIRYVPEVRYIPSQTVDTLFYLTHTGSATVHISEVRKRLITYLLKDIEGLLIYHFSETKEHTLSNDYLLSDIEWNGDWAKNIEVKIVVNIEVDIGIGKDLEVVIKWKFHRERNVWELYEVTHGEKEEE